MTTDRDANNRRILIIDDNVSIHEDFRKILSPPIESGALDHARAALFGEAPTIPTHVPYELEFSTQGREGFGLVHGLTFDESERGLGHGEWSLWHEPGAISMASWG